jgi:hypothetical protein
MFGAKRCQEFRIEIISLGKIGESDVWFASRHDAHLLFPSPAPPDAAESNIGSTGSVGRPDLPADDEDTFFLAPIEVESIITGSEDD